MKERLTSPISKWGSPVPYKTAGKSEKAVHRMMSKNDYSVCSKDLYRSARRGLPVQWRKKKKKALAVTAQNVNSKCKKRCFASFVIGEIERSQWTIATAATTHTHTGGAETAGQGPRVKEGLTGGKAQAVLTGLKTKQPGTTQSRNLWWKSGDIMICGPEVLLRIQIQVCSCTWTHVQRRPQQCYLWEQSNRHHPMSINKRRINYDDSTLQGRATNCWYSEQREQTSQTQCWRAEASHASGQFMRSGIILFRETCIAINQ